MPCRRPMPQPPKLPIEGVKNLVAVASGKGGVGKTTVAVNLALALKRLGASVGLLDADVYGPNVPIMLGTDEQPQALSERQILPVEAQGVKLISMGLLNPGDKPMIWRGPMLHSVMQQFLRSVVWGELDYLIVDLPPGTGRRAAFVDSNGAGHRRGPGHHAVGRRAGRCPQGHRDVSPGERGHSRHRREHELLQLPALPGTHRRLRPRRRPPHRRSLRRAAARRNRNRSRKSASAAIRASRLRCSVRTRPEAKSIYAMARAVAARLEEKAGCRRAARSSKLIEAR